MIRSVIHAFVVFLFQALSHLDVQGWEKVPVKGGGLLVSNHMSRLDAPLIFALLTRPDTTALVADTYKRVPVLGRLIEAVGGIWINREQVDFHALKAAREYVQGGGLLGIAPEGKRSKTGGLIKAKTGVAYLADKAGCQIIPMAIWGTDGAIRKLLHLQRPTIHVQVGDPFYLPRLKPGDRSAALQCNTDEIMLRIAVLLPPEHQGVYAGHIQMEEFR